MTSIQVPICMACSRLRDPANQGETFHCEAFPHGIPDAVFEEGFDHRLPYPGDGGIRFELDPDHTAALRIYDDRRLLR